MSQTCAQANQSDGCAAGSPNLSDVKDFDLSDPNALNNGRRTFQCYFQNSFQVLSETWAKNMKRSQPRGVIMSAGTPYSLTNAFVNLYTLRHHLKSDLPFVIMLVILFQSFNWRMSSKILMHVIPPPTFCRYWGAQKEDRPTNATINFFKVCLMRRCVYPVKLATL